MYCQLFTPLHDNIEALYNYIITFSILTFENELKSYNVVESTASEANAILAVLQNNLQQ